MRPAVMSARACRVLVAGTPAGSSVAANNAGEPAARPCRRKGQSVTHRILAIACGALVAVGAGCSHKTTGNSILTASAGGRELKATVEGPAWVKPTDEAFTVTFTGHKVVIEKERVLFDGLPQAGISAAAKKLEVICTNATVRVRVDGTEVCAFGIAKSPR